MIGKNNVTADIGAKTQFGAPGGNDNTKGGRNVSIRNQLKSILGKDGKIKIPANQVISVNSDGSVSIRLPKQEAMALQLLSWAMSKKGGDSLKAIQMIMDQVDGRPTQKHVTDDGEGGDAPITGSVDYSKLSTETLKDIVKASAS